MQPMSVVEGSFASPVFDAQSTFRAVMDAMARPGSRQQVAPLAQPPAPFSVLAASVALTLCDHDTPVWLDKKLSQPAVRDWLGFHTGAPVTALATDAHFAFAACPEELIAFENFTQGSQEYPDRSTTVVLQVDSFDTGAPLMLSGPGVETTATIAPQPMPRHFAAQWKQNRARFPRGVDLILVSPGAIVCLPRTVRIADTGA